MKVFLSWSGQRSGAIAEALKGWLPIVLQRVEPYFSPEDVAKGSRWSSEIAKELEASRIALLIVTPDNLTAPWLLFEAGAISKNLDNSKVCPLLFGGMEATDVKGPLVQFQAAKFSEIEMRRVLQTINGELGESALAPGIFDSVFAKWWPDLKEKVERGEADAAAANDGPLPRSDRDLIEELLAISRASTQKMDEVIFLAASLASDSRIAGVTIDSIRQQTARLSKMHVPRAVGEESMRAFKDLAAVAFSSEQPVEMLEAIVKLARAMEKLLAGGVFGPIDDPEVVVRSIDLNGIIARASIQIPNPVKLADWKS